METVVRDYAAHAAVLTTGLGAGPAAPHSPHEHRIPGQPAAAARVNIGLVLLDFLGSYELPAIIAAQLVSTCLGAILENVLPQITSFQVGHESHLLALAISGPEEGGAQAGGLG